ncbi:MAG: hypothetical protein ACOZB3_03300, partial [Calditrichota bacterium]
GLGVAATTDNAGYYSLHFGINIVKNIALAVLALLSPVNTVSVALDGIVWGMMAALFSCIILGFILWGLYRSFRSEMWKLPVLLWILFFVVQGPVFLMPHLTEANMTRSLALGWLAVALTIRPLYEDLIVRRRRVLLILLCAGWLLFDLTAVYSKSRDIGTGPTRADRFRNEMKTVMPAPLQRPIVFATHEPSGHGYSVYRQPFLDDLRWGEIPFGLRDVYQDPDLETVLLILPDGPSVPEDSVDFWINDDGSLRSVH